MIYIKAASSITHQKTFQYTGFTSELLPLENDSTLITPDYKQFIAPQLLRRMGKLLRMSVANAKCALEEAGIETPDAIVVGTGLGCLQDTEKFLQNFITLEGLIPPTAFIQSTHNTIAGQISLSLNCHGYNMTHTQNSLSFEMALIDAMMLVKEGESNVLLGAADEEIPLLNEVALAFGNADINLTSGASFFVVGDQPNEQSILVTDCFVHVGDYLLEEKINTFLEKNQLSISDIDHLVEGVCSDDVFLTSRNALSYVPLVGVYPSNSAFGFHCAIDRLRKASGTALLINRLYTNHLGLTLLKSIEA